MANMSYCRFENTKRDVEDCLDAVRDGDIASQHELEKAKGMFEDILLFLQANGIIDDYDGDELHETLQAGFEEEDE
ncbi:hypothetical protein IMZ31_19870 (plasmid) [Pontibacillus sp. ALD_SL1]|uniref:hypothetical protein n=1 Tax=Pontibacillus sp. ALD_SL1 TaxID=2777185 RepID=UPI001A963227|nr:hypothetical protein [Pontibacillus sp. ALD_SL1]QST02810.1 hypothetical protein IMZ31_19870 [Pontibacillus sp. ALD_SL1]